MVLNNLTVTGDFRVRHTDSTSGAEIYDKVINLEYGNSLTLLKGFYDLFLFDFPNGKLFGKNIQEDIAITNKLVGEGDGSTKTFTATLNTPVKPNTVQITHTYNDGSNDVTVTATDDGSGNITGTNIDTATIDYSTGDLSITTTEAPVVDTPILADFTIGSAADDTLNLGFYFDLATDTNPSTDENAFTQLVTLSNPTLSIIDWYQTETDNIYSIVMSGVYDSATAMTEKVTALQLGFKAAQGDSLDVTTYDKLILKSLAPSKTDLFGETGLLLANKAEIFVKLQFKVRK